MAWRHTRRGVTRLPAPGHQRLSLQTRPRRARRSRVRSSVISSRCAAMSDSSPPRSFADAVVRLAASASEPPALTSDASALTSCLARLVAMESSRARALSAQSANLSSRSRSAL